LKNINKKIGAYKRRIGVFVTDYFLGCAKKKKAAAALPARGLSPAPAHEHGHAGHETILKCFDCVLHGIRKTQTGANRQTFYFPCRSK
jgi:hypothetical protein